MAKSPLHSTGAASRLNCVVRRSHRADHRRKRQCFRGLFSTFGFGSSPNPAPPPFFASIFGQFSRLPKDDPKKFWPAPPPPVAPRQSADTGRGGAGTAAAPQPGRVAPCGHRSGRGMALTARPGRRCPHGPIQLPNLLSVPRKRTVTLSTRKGASTSSIPLIAPSMDSSCVHTQRCPPDPGNIGLSGSFVSPSLTTPKSSPLESMVYTDRCPRVALQKRSVKPARAAVQMTVLRTPPGCGSMPRAS